MRCYLLALTAVLLLTARIHQAHGQKAKAYHKPAPKPVIHNRLTDVQLYTIYQKQGVPGVDEYLTSKNWRFVGSEPGDSLDRISYNHKNSNGFIDSEMYIFLCNRSDNGICIKPNVHDEPNRQHVFQLSYIVTKSVYEELQKEVRSHAVATSSLLGDNTMRTTYKFATYRFMFILEKDDEGTNYKINFGDILPSELKEE